MFLSLLNNHRQVKHYGVICSADDYFLNNNNVYVYDAAKLNDAHVFCKTQGKYYLIDTPQVRTVSTFAVIWLHFASSS